MGGDHGHGGFDTKLVWSPSGGWYPDPRGWRRNTAVAFGAVALISLFVGSVSASLEVRSPPTRSGDTVACARVDAAASGAACARSERAAGRGPASPAPLCAAASGFVL